MVMLRILLALALIVLVTGNEDHEFKSKGPKIEKFKGSRDAKIKRLKDSTEDFPENLPIEISTDSGDGYTIYLRRNKNLDLNRVNVNFADEGSNSVKKAKGKRRDDVVYYTDESKGAVITVTRKNNKYLYEGTITTGTDRFELKPVLNKGILTEVLTSVDIAVNYESDDLNNPEPGNITNANPPSDDDKPRPDPQYFMDKDTIQDDFRNDRENRKKRAVHLDQSAFHVELMFVLDYSTYDHWVNVVNNGDVDAGVDEMLTYFGHMFNGIQMVYSSISAHYADLTIVPWLKEIFICNTPESSWMTRDIALANPKVDNPDHTRDYALPAAEAFEEISNWRYEMGYNWSNPDHMMVWTRYDINGNGVIGVAPGSGICKGSSSWGGASIVEDVGPHSWVIAAHEKAHNYGAPHDGSDNDCQTTDKYLMAPSVGYLHEETFVNTWAFSPCSVARMRDTLLGLVDGYPRACVFDAVCEHGVVVQDMDVTLPGEVYSLDEQCQMLLSDKPDVTFGTGWCATDNLCLKMRCISGSSCYSIGWAADGTPCGAGQWCISGECVDTTVTRSLVGDISCDVYDHVLPPGVCLDQAGYQLYINYYGNLRYMSCEDIIKENPEFCFKFSSVTSGCDKTCIENGLVFESTPCDGSCNDTPNVTFNGGVNCTQAAFVKGWCRYDVVTDYCCGSCETLAHSK